MTAAQRVWSDALASRDRAAARGEPTCWEEMIATRTSGQDNVVEGADAVPWEVDDPAG